MSTEQEKRLAFAIRVFAQPGSATECGKCRLCVGRVCAGFDKTLDTKPITRFGAAKLTLRLPECIAAEKGTGQC